MQRKSNTLVLRSAYLVCAVEGDDVGLDLRLSIFWDTFIRGRRLHTEHRLGGLNPKQSTCTKKNYIHSIVSKLITAITTFI